MTFSPSLILPFHKGLGKTQNQIICPKCLMNDNLIKNGTYPRYHPDKKQKVVVQKRFCKACDFSFSTPPFSLLRLFQFCLEGLFCILILYGLVSVALLASLLDCSRSTIRRRFSRLSKVIHDSIAFEGISWPVFIDCLSRTLFPLFYPS